MKIAEKIAIVWREIKLSRTHIQRRWRKKSVLLNRFVTFLSLGKRKAKKSSWWLLLNRSNRYVSYKPFTRRRRKNNVQFRHVGSRTQNGGACYVFFVPFSSESLLIVLNLQFWIERRFSSIYSLSIIEMWLCAVCCFFAASEIFIGLSL